MSVRFGRDADDDLLDMLLTGAATFGPAQAERYYRDLLRSVDLLAANPLMGRLRTELRRPVRLHRFRSHVIVYLDEDGGILILRILHGRQDWFDLLTH